jgi:hypothetical protein
MSSAIIDGTNIDLSVISYSAPKANPLGGKVINMFNKNFKESLTLSLPLLSAWGAQESKETVGKDAAGKPITKGTGKYTISLQFPNGQYSTPESIKCLEELNKLFEKIKEDAMTNSKEWFGKEIKSKDVIEEKFTSMLKYPKIKGTEEYDYSKTPSLTLKLPCWKSVWQTSVFDEDGNALYLKNMPDCEFTPLDYLSVEGKAPIQIITLIQSGGLWFVNGKISITWNLMQVAIKKPRTSAISNDVCHLTIKPSEKEALRTQPDVNIINDADGSVSAYVDDSDEESEPVAPPTPAPVPVAPPTPEPVVEPEPEPTPVETAAPATKKKVVAKKTVKKDA